VFVLLRAAIIISLIFLYSPVRDRSEPGVAEGWAPRLDAEAVGRAWPALARLWGTLPGEARQDMADAALRHAASRVLAPDPAPTSRNER
jgi:hypothetical protein